MINRVVDVPGFTDTEIGIIPNRCTSALTKLLTTGAENAQFIIDPNKTLDIIFNTKVYLSARFRMQLITVNYPDYKRLIPQTYDLLAVFNREELLRTINTGMLFAVDDVDRVYFEFDSFGLNVRARSNTRGEYEDYLTAITTAGALGNTFILNGSLVTGWLRSQNTDNIQFECRNGNRNPIILRGAEHSENGFMLLPPMVMGQE